jgi:hypothetical protein
MPFSFTPRISDENKSLPVHLNSFENRVCMSFIDTLTISTTPEDTSGTSEEELLVHFHEFFFPEVLLVEDVSAKDLGCHPSGQVFETFSSMTSFDGSIVLFSLDEIVNIGGATYTMGLSVGLLEKWKPCLVWILALSKVKCSRTSLS